MNKIIKIFFLLLIPTIGYGLSYEYDTTKYNNSWGKTAYLLYDRLQEIGYSANVSAHIINRCKEVMPNPLHCIYIAGAVGYAESSSCLYARGNNCRGLRGKKFKNKGLAFDRWIKSYKKYWYKSTGYDLYGYNGKSGKNRYCVDEYSSGTIGRCPNGLKNYYKCFNLLNK